MAKSDRIGDRSSVGGAPRGRTLEPAARGPSGFIALCEPNVTGNEWEYLRQCIDTGWVSSVGAFVERFECDLAERLGVAHAIAMTSGTAALHVALLSCGIEPDEEVIVPTLTFIAPANAVRYVGAWPAFVDAEPRQWQLDPTQVEAFLREDCTLTEKRARNKRTGRTVTGLLPVDILGHPCDLERLRGLADEFGLRVIEDATESLGATYRGTPLGCISPVSCFSFNGNKLLTTGGGGMLVTNDPVVARRARYLATQAKDDPVEYVHANIGFNYRLSNVQAAIGCAQLERFDEFVTRKREIASRYREGLADIPGVTVMTEATWAQAVFWLFTILIDETEFGMGSRALLATLDDRGIQTRPLWQPLHLSVAHQGSFARPCPIAERLNAQALSLPCSTGLSSHDQGLVIAAIREASAGGR